jgi:hypothetical protein
MTSRPGRGLGLLDDLLERPGVLGLEPLAHAHLRGVGLGALDLEAVAQLAALVRGAAQRADLRLQGDARPRRRRPGLVQAAQLDGHGVALGEQLLQHVAGARAHALQLLSAARCSCSSRSSASSRGRLGQVLPRLRDAPVQCRQRALRPGVRDAQLGLLVAHLLPRGLALRQRLRRLLPAGAVLRQPFSSAVRAVRDASASPARAR